MPSSGVTVTGFPDLTSIPDYIVLTKTNMLNHPVQVHFSPDIKKIDYI